MSSISQQIIKGALICTLCSVAACMDRGLQLDLLPRDSGDPFAGLQGYWTGSATHLDRSWAVDLDMVTGAGGIRAHLDLPEYGIYCLPLDVTPDRRQVVLSSDGGGTVLRVLRQGPRLSGPFQSVGVHGTVTLRRVGPPRDDFTHEEVVFFNDNTRLVGTLIKPRSEGPHPAVVWTHGSGPQSRETPHYAGRGYLVARHGVASFIYDKRGAGQSSGEPYADLELLADDALQAVAAISRRPDIDAERTGIGGFSQGAWISPLVAARSQNVAFVVVGATPGITPADQNAFTLQNRLRNEGFPQQEVQQAVDLLHEVYEFYRTAEGRQQLQGRLDDHRHEEWFAQWFERFMFLPDTTRLPERMPPAYARRLDFDPLPLWRQITVPVLSMWGEHDDNVPVHDSQARIAAALLEAGNHDYSLLIYPQAGHGLAVVRAQHEPWDWPRLAAGFHDAMVDWIVTRSRRG